MALSRLVIVYVARRRAAGQITEETAQQLRSRLLDFARSTPVSPDRVTRRHVERWAERPGLSPHYRRSRLSALRNFCRWCVLNKHMRRDPTIGVPLPPLPKLLPRCLSHDEAVATCTTAAEDPRAEIVCLLIFQEALRRGEVARILVPDIDLRAGVLAVRGKGGQGNVNRRVPITTELLPVLERYMEANDLRHGPLIRSRTHPDRGVTPSTIGDIVRRVMYAAKVKRRPLDGRSAHAGRHTAAQEIVDDGVDVRILQRFLGHASLNSTLIYVAGEVNGLREMVDGRRYRTL